MNSNRQFLLGADVGGTKCASSLGYYRNGRMTILGRRAFATAQAGPPQQIIAKMVEDMKILLNKQKATLQDAAAIGVSCGGPLDSKRGLVLGPPNLPGWDHVHVTQLLADGTGRPAFLENDANACALAEWRWGAGQCSHMIFLTFGTGMGGGLILNNKLYRGACDLAGEVGHMRLAENGPEGYGKSGSFEGFCSGGGLLRAAHMAGLTHINSAHELFTHAAQGHAECLRIIERSSRQLGRGLAILIDLFNPQRIVIGSIFVRQEALIRPFLEEELRREALPSAVSACRIVPAALSENIGDYAALAVAQNGIDSHEN